MRTTIRLFLLATLVTGAACTVKDTTAPPLSGPSELALRLALQITPDSIMQDGASQAVLTIDASTPDGRAARGLAMRVEILVDGIIQDYGTLSAKSVVTGEDGRARVSYTAPPRPASQVDAVNVIQLRVTPIGSDYGGEVGRFVSLRLMTPGVILPPNESPGAAFTFSPEAPAVLQDVVFDAASSVDGPVDDSGSRARCGASCQYQWDFGDGGTGTGVFVSHRFQRTGVYLVKLTVTDGGGASATITQAVTVAQGQAPSASFTFSPASPAISQDIFFNASSSTAVSGRRIVAYDWDFGSGRTGSGMTITKRYDTAGTYVVTLTVTDDSGSQAIARNDVTVGGTGTGPVAQFTVSPSSGGTTDTQFFFDGRSSSGPSPIAEYRFTFGDGTAEVVSTTGTTTHQFAIAGTYVVRLTVRDTANRSATSTNTVQVAASTAPGSPGAPTPSFTFSPTTPTVNQTVFFNGSGSTTPAGTTITSYAWDFGDGTTGSGATPSHAFSTAGTYVVRLNVTNSAGQTGTLTQTVPVTTATPVPPGAPTASYTFSPTAPTVDQTVFFNGSGSTTPAGTTITSYAWDFGDGTTSTGATTNHVFSAPATYVVRLTVTNSGGQTGTVTQNVAVSGLPQAVLTASPTSGSVTTNFFFDGRASTGSIATYRFTFGDGTEVSNATGTTTKAYAAPGSYVVRLTITDTAGRTATTTVTLNVTP